MTIAVTEAIQSLNDVETAFDLRRSTDPDFFGEWQGDLQELTAIERATLDRIKQSYLHHLMEGIVSEGMVNLLMVSPLAIILCLSSDKVLFMIYPMIFLCLSNRVMSFSRFCKF